MKKQRWIFVLLAIAAAFAVWLTADAQSSWVGPTKDYPPTAGYELVKSGTSWSQTFGAGEYIAASFDCDGKWLASQNRTELTHRFDLGAGWEDTPCYHQMAGDPEPPDGQWQWKVFSLQRETTILFERREDSGTGYLWFKPTPPTITELTLNAACPTPGVDSNDLTVTGVVKDQHGQPMVDVVVTVDLPDGSHPTVKTNSNGQYSYAFIGAKQYIGQSITVHAGNLSQTLGITEQQFEECVTPPTITELTLNAACPTPGVDSNDLTVTGVVKDQHGQPMVDVVVTVDLPDGSHPTVKTNSNGQYSYAFIGAKQYIGQSITVHAGNLSQTLGITEQQFEECVTPPTITELTLNAACPTPGVDSNDLTVTGVVKDQHGQPMVDVVVTVDLPDGSHPTVKTNSNCQYSYAFIGAKQYIGQSITVHAGNLSQTLGITEQQFEECVTPPTITELTLNAACPTPGVDSNDLTVTGVVKDQHGQPMVDVVVTVDLPDGSHPTVKTNSNGQYSYAFIGAKQYIGQSITVHAGNLSQTLGITEQQFEECVTPPTITELTLNAACPTPGVDSNDLTVTGVVKDQHGQPMVDVVVTVDLPDGSHPTVKTNSNGQ